MRVPEALCMLFLCCTTSLLPSAQEAANGGTDMLLLLLTLALTLPLLAAMALAALALLDLIKRDATPFLAPVLVSFPSGVSGYMPFGVWQVYRLAATSHDSLPDSEG